MAQLRAAVDAPVHAYLLVGPRGSGKRAAARAFGGDLLAAGSVEEEAERHWRLAVAEQHPDLHVVERTGAAISKEMADDIVREASRSAIEGQRKVLVLDEFHLVVDRAAGALLKTIEEPPVGTFFLVLAEEITPDLVTIASRCLRVELASVSSEAIEAKLRAEAVADDAAAEAARASHGDLRRARLLATDARLALRLRAWAALPRRLDGRGHTAATLVDELRAAIDDAQAPLDAQHDREATELTKQVERSGLRGAGAGPLRERQKREKRRFRSDELRMGLAELARSYRDELAVSTHPAPLVHSLDAIQAASEALVRNPNEELLLQALLVALASGS